jgi:hypothetical protein
MSADPAEGVVNKHGQTHDVANLFISEGSQYTTRAAENPTLTIVTVPDFMDIYSAGRNQGSVSTYARTRTGVEITTADFHRERPTFPSPAALVDEERLGSPGASILPLPAARTRLRAVLFPDRLCPGASCLLFGE